MEEKAVSQELHGHRASDVTKLEDDEKGLERGPSTLSRVTTFPKELERRVRRKLDWNMIPLILILYSLSVLDRSNIGNARVAGMATDLNLVGNKYQWLLNIFYIPYILFEWLTILWKVFPPHRYVAVVVFLWGFAATMQAVTTSWSGMMACRFFLGAIECGFGPGIPLYLSFFYPRHEAGLRIGIFLSGSALANAYGGALAYGLSHINSGIAPWRLLFILEGIPTCLLAIVAWFYFADSPAKCRFLNEEETKVAVARAQRQPHAAEVKGLQLGQVLSAFKDYRSISFLNCIDIDFMTALMYFGCNVSFASLPVFLPTIISQMGGFTTLQSNGLSAPPYLLCFFMIIGSAFLSDKIRMRGIFVYGMAFIAAIGFLIMAVATKTAVRYFATFLCVLIFVSVAIILVWVANNAATDSKRAGGFWILQTIGQCGPLLGTNVFPSTDAPYYRKGMWVCCAFCFFVAMLGASLSFLLWKENKRRDELYGKGTGVSAFDETVDAGTLGDQAPSFRYVI